MKKQMWEHAYRNTCLYAKQRDNSILITIHVLYSNLVIQPKYQPTMSRSTVVYLCNHWDNDFEFLPSIVLSAELVALPIIWTLANI